MADYRKNEIVSGVFICVAIIVLGLFAFRVGSFDLWGLFKGPVVVCKANFLTVKSMSNGADVRVAGQRVGEVVAIKMVERALTREQVETMKGLSAEMAGSDLHAGMLRQLVEVKFELKDPTLKLDPPTARVSLAQDSLLAPHYLDLDPGVWTTDARPKTIFEAGFEVDTLILAREQSGFEELVAMAKPVIREMNSTLGRVNEKILTDENTAALSGAIRHFNELLGETHTVVTSIRDYVISDKNVERIDRILENLDKTASVSRDISGEVAKLLDRDQDPRLNEILDALALTSQKLEGRVDAVQRDLQAVLQSSQKVIVENQSNLAESIRRLRRSLWQAEMAMRKIRANPAVLFFGDDETDYQAEGLDESSARRKGQAAPFGQKDETR